MTDHALLDPQCSAEVVWHIHLMLLADLVCSSYAQLCPPLRPALQSLLAYDEHARFDILHLEDKTSSPIKFRFSRK